MKSALFIGGPMDGTRKMVGWRRYRVMEMDQQPLAIWTAQQPVPTPPKIFEYRAIDAFGDAQVELFMVPSHWPEIDTNDLLRRALVEGYRNPPEGGRST